MNPVVVKIESGEVRGTLVDARADGPPVRRFLGVPYAAAPFGANRFRPPAPVTAWTGVRDALDPGPTSPSPGYAPPFDALFDETAVPGEEILNLNIWAPESADGAPVMVWVHGGAFINGSNAGPLYDGARFARDGVVLVSINYRLGCEGFLLLPGGTPNLGLLDQLAALRWVRDNIGAFGGDAGTVTVFGESAGGMSIGALLAMPASAGLFRRAILQSGACHHALSAATAARVAGYAADAAGVNVGDLAQVPPQQLVQVQQQLSVASQQDPDPERWGEITGNAMVFEPVVDGELLPDLPVQAVAAGSASGVDVLVGANRDEARLFLVPTGLGDRVTDEMLGAVAVAYRLPAGALDAYRAARPGASSGMVLADVMTDWFYRLPAIRLAEAHGRAYVYEFDWASPLFDGRLGAAHATEIPFVFDALDKAVGMLGTAPPQELADEMHRAWVAFATTGDPGWEPYGEQRRVRRFGDVVETDTDPRGDLRELWDGIR